MPEFEVDEWLVRIARDIQRVEDVPFQEALARAILREGARQRRAREQRAAEDEEPPGPEMSS